MTHAERVVVVAATVALAGLLTMWAVIAPTYRSSDEPMHVSTTMRLAESGRYPAPGRALMDPSVLASFRWVDYFGATGRAPKPERAAPLAHPPSMAALGAPDAPRPRTDVDQMTQHPPAYYLVLAGAVRALRLDALDPTSLVLALRLLTALMLLPVPWLCQRLARRLGLPARVAGAAAFVPAAWMQLLHSSSTVNNGALLALATGVATAAVVPAALGDVRLRRAVGVGLAVSVALLTKGFALALLPVVVVAYLVAIRRAGLWRSVRAMVVALLATLPGLWWWVLNVVRYGTVQPQGGATAAPVADLPPLSTWAHDFALTWMRTLWIALGWAENRPPARLTVGLTVLAAVLLLAGTWVLRRRLGAALVMHLTWLGPLAIVVLGSYREFESSGTTRAAQGRYVQTGVVALVVLATAALAHLSRLVLALPLLVVGLAGGGLVFGLDHFWAPEAGYEPLWGRVLAAGSWLPGGTTWLIAAAAVTVVATLVGTAALKAVASSARTTSPEPRPEPVPVG